MSAYTLLQFFEVALFGLLLMYGILSHHPSVAVLGGGLLIGKAVLNILAPEGGSLYRRSLIGYLAGGVFVAFGIIAVKLIG